jgi:tetratricopeptide (TPR) repeat protein
MIGPSIALLVFFGAAADPAALSDQAQKFAERKQFAEAERLWKSSIAADAKYFPALFNLGYFYYSHGRYAEAVTFLERAADANPDDFNSRYLLGASQSKLNRTDAALRAWRVAQTLKPNQAKLLSLMVVEYGKGRYFNEAAEVAKLALKVNRDDETTFYLAIKALADAGDSAGAQEILKIRQDGTVPPVLATGYGTRSEVRRTAILSCRVIVRFGPDRRVASIC